LGLKGFAAAAVTMTEFIILLLHIYEGGRVLSPAEFQVRVMCPDRLALCSERKGRRLG
jgi:hypothetical protein